MSDGYLPGQELAERLVSDTARHVAISRELLAGRVAAAIGAEEPAAHHMIDGEHIAATIFDELLSDDELEEVCRDALERVRADYLGHAREISDVIADLVAEGRESWIGSALRHRFAFDATWEALDALGELTELPALTCQNCGVVVEP